MSCASCHDPAHHYARRLKARRSSWAGRISTRPGIRAVPSLTYKIDTPPFSVGPENAAEELTEAAPMAEASGVALASQTAPIGGPVAGQPVAKAVAAADNAVPAGRHVLGWSRRHAAGAGTRAAALALRDGQCERSACSMTRSAALWQAAGALFGAGGARRSVKALAEAGFALARYQVEDPPSIPIPANMMPICAARHS